MQLQNDNKSERFKSDNPLTELLKYDTQVFNKKSYPPLKYSHKKDLLTISVLLAMGALCMVPVWNINLWQPPRTTIGDGGVGGSQIDATPAPDSGIGGSPVRDR
jgi:hypothetical protein